MALPGHGAEVAIELDPVGSPGTFTVIGSLVDITWPAFSRENENVTPHSVNIAERLTSPVLDVGTLEIEANYDPADPGQAAIPSAIFSNDTWQWYVRGPGGSSGSDELLFDGEVVNYQQATPVRTGARTLSATVQPSGNVTVDGAVITGV